MEDARGVRGGQRVGDLHARTSAPSPTLSRPWPITWASDGPATYSIAMKSTPSACPMS